MQVNTVLYTANALCNRCYVLPALWFISSAMDAVSEQKQTTE